MQDNWNSTGRFERTLDAKGRLVLPPALREQFDGLGGYMKIGKDGCLDLVDPETYSKDMNAILERTNRRDVRRMMRSVAGDSVRFRPDGQGRVSIEARLMTFAGIAPGDTVKIVGAFDRYELWNPERLESQEMSAEEYLDFGEGDQ